MKAYIDAGSLGEELEVEVTYDYKQGLPATYIDPAEGPFVEITNIHVVKYGFDIDLRAFNDYDCELLEDQIIEYEQRNA